MSAKALLEQFLAISRADSNLTGAAADEFANKAGRKMLSELADMVKVKPEPIPDMVKVKPEPIPDIVKVKPQPIPASKVEVEVVDSSDVSDTEAVVEVVEKKKGMLLRKRAVKIAPKKVHETAIVVKAEPKKTSKSKQATENPTHAAWRTKESDLTPNVHEADNILRLMSEDVLDSYFICDFKMSQPLLVEKLFAMRKDKVSLHRWQQVLNMLVPGSKPSNSKLEITIELAKWVYTYKGTK